MRSAARGRDPEGRTDAAPPLPRRVPHDRGAPGAKSFVDDLILGQGFVRSRAAPSLRSIENQPSTQAFVSEAADGGQHSPPLKGKATGAAAAGGCRGTGFRLPPPTSPRASLSPPVWGDGAGVEGRPAPSSLSPSRARLGVDLAVSVARGGAAPVLRGAQLPPRAFLLGAEVDLASAFYRCPGRPGLRFRRFRLAGTPGLRPAHGRLGGESVGLGRAARHPGRLPGKGKSPPGPYRRRYAGANGEAGRAPRQK